MNNYENMFGIRDEFMTKTAWNIVDFTWIPLISALAILVLCQTRLSAYMEKSTLLKLCKYGKLTAKLEAQFDIIELPKQYFTHYYIFLLLWTGFLTVLVTLELFGFKLNEYISTNMILSLSSERNLDRVSLFISLVLIIFQGARRFYECVAVSVFSHNAKINGFQYLLGFLFYGMEPLTLLCEAGPINEMPCGKLQLRHIFGIFGFLLSSFYQHLSLSQLSRLRKTKHDKSYKIPCDHLFNYVSCPHYFTEILIYLFLGCTVGFGHKSWRYVLIFVILIHVLMADMSHKWYKQKFETYPKHRKALIPYMY